MRQLSLTLNETDVSPPTQPETVKVINLDSSSLENEFDTELIEPRQLTVIHDGYQAHLLSETVCLQELAGIPALKPARVVWVDGGNAFDVYFMANLARAQGFNVTPLLKNLYISRAFTLQQFVTLLERLPQTYQRYKPSLIIISDALAQCYNSGMRTQELTEEVTYLTRLTADLARRFGSKFIATLISTSPNAFWQLESYLTSRAHKIIQIKDPLFHTSMHGRLPGTSLEPCLLNFISPS